MALDEPILRIERLGTARDLPLPRYQTGGAAGLDLHAAVPFPLLLQPGERALIPAGVRIALPTGYEGQIRARSGLALRHGVTVLNAPGTIDADFRGEVGIVLINLGQVAFTVERGMRVAQLVIQRVPRAQVVEEERLELDGTARGSNGFGHTGLEAERGR